SVPRSNHQDRHCFPTRRSSDLEATPSQIDAAREVGRLLAKSGAVVINGGYGGVSAAASEGAAGEGGTVVGLLSEGDRDGANPHLDRKSTRLNSSHVKSSYAVLC